MGKVMVSSAITKPQARFLAPRLTEMGEKPLGGSKLHVNPRQSEDDFINTKWWFSGNGDAANWFISWIILNYFMENWGYPYDSGHL